MSGTSASNETSPTAQVVDSKLRVARSELEKAFTEIHTVNLVEYDEKVWTPRFQDLGNMDRDLVGARVETARGALSDAAQHVASGSKRAVRVELLEHVSSIAQLGSEFYYLFAMTFEKVYQYEFLINERGDYERAVEKMGVARKNLAGWEPIAEQLTEKIETIKRLYDEHDTLEAKISTFDIGRWNYTTFGAEQYPYLLEPRFVGFEAYAEAVSADLEGLDHIDADSYQAAQESFEKARRKIQQASVRFSEADSRGRSFFEARARVYDNRTPIFDDGYLLHLRAANEFVRGNVENAKDLRFEGTTKIRNAFAKYSIDTDRKTATADSE